MMESPLNTVWYWKIFGAAGASVLARSAPLHVVHHIVSFYFSSMIVSEK
jgi:hypothetical protein